MRPVISPCDAAVDAKCMIRLADTKFVEKNIGHIAIEMLAGMDEHFDKIVRAGQSRAKTAQP